MCPYTFQKCPFIPRVTLLFSRIALSFSRSAFISRSCPFVSQKRSFVFQKCLFVSRKCCIVFQNCSFVFQKCLQFIYCVRLFSRTLFFAADYAFSSCLELLREIIFTCSSFVFFLELFIDQLIIRSW